MTLEEAIKHAEKMANTYEDMMDDYVLDSKKLHKCANEHRQLAEWLRELQKRRKMDSREGCINESGKSHLLVCCTCRRHYHYADLYEPEKGEPMSKCKDCKYAESSNYRISNIECCTCSLTRRVLNANAESNCNCFNRDLSEYDICYNCKYYGGGDWGLFCSHKDMYHHLGKFSDAPCKRYERRTDESNI